MGSMLLLSMRSVTIKGPLSLSPNLKSTKGSLEDTLWFHGHLTDFGIKMKMLSYSLLPIARNIQLSKDKKQLVILKIKVLLLLTFGLKVTTPLINLLMAIIIKTE